MTTQHTPGPWAHSPGQDTIWARDGNLLIASTDYTRGEMAINEDNANASLIAASPDLLTACESALALLTNPNAEPFDADAVTAILRTAIAKAKGEA
jgi:hypothetical protein